MAKAAYWTATDVEARKRGGGILIAFAAAPKSFAPRHLVVIVYGVDYQGI